MALICRFYLFKARQILMLRISYSRARLDKRFFIILFNSLWLIKSNESNEI